ncbi:ABC transporter permease [Lutispora sp.]|uniref:ABC transporter permease n=1 Tax=Lutispora sp. TaxID=2828727 RepID=UPI00356259BC
MRIILKFVLKNIKSNKFRTFLIIFSICVSTALFFASMAISSTMENLYLERLKMYYGSSEIIIHPGADSPSRFVDSHKAENTPGIEYAAGILQTGGYYNIDDKEIVPLIIKAVKFEDLQKMGVLAITGESNIEPFLGNKIIIGKTTADKYGLSVGDIMDVEIANSRMKFRISGISEPIGFFYDNASNITVVAPINTISTIYDAKGRFTELYVKLKDSSRLNEMMDVLAEEYNRYIVRETITEAELKNASSGISTPFILMTGIVLFMSIFIMYTSYKVIIAERLPIIGTFRSIGATRRSTNFVLLFESTGYGVIGGFLGCILGIGILMAMTKTIMPTWAAGVGLKISYTPLQFVAAFVLALILSIVSSIFPIRKAVKTSVKDIIFLSSVKSGINKRWKTIVAIPLIIISILVPPQLPRRLILPVGFPLMVLSTLAIVLLIPFITAILLRLLEGLYSKIFGNEGILAAKNLRHNKSIANNIALLTIGISSILMINTVSSSVLKEVTSFYKNLDFDIFMELDRADKNLLNMIKATDGVEGAYGIFQKYGTKTNRGNARINLIHGIDVNKFSDFIHIDLENDKENTLMQLEEGRNILLSESLMEQLMVKKGDTIGIEMADGMKNYRIIGSFYSLMYNGSYAIISDKYYKLDTGQSYYSEIYIKTSKDPEKVAIELKERFARRFPWIMTVKESERRDSQSNKMLLDIMTGFSVAAMVIGVFGVLNNYTISFIERKRFLAMYRSMGMSKAQMIKMIFIEAFTGGIIGGTMGALGGIILIYLVPSILKYLVTDIPMHYSISMIGASIVTGIVISVIASISPALKSSKLSIIENIKYE